jgi:hypothetical protein
MEIGKSKSMELCKVMEDIWLRIISTRKFARVEFSIFLMYQKAYCTFTPKDFNESILM